MGARFADSVDEAEVLSLLGVDQRGLRTLLRDGGFPSPMGSGNEDARWSVSAIRDWLATTGFRPVGELLATWWPAPGTPARLENTQVAHDIPHAKPAAVLQHWQTDAGTIVLAWPIRRIQITGDDLARWAPDTDSYLIINGDWTMAGPTPGPAVLAYPGAHPDARGKFIAWRDLARVLGQPVPFWPHQLRHPELIATWRPGDPIVRHVGVLTTDLEPLMRMALLYPADHHVHHAMIETARVIHSRADAAGCTDLRTLAGLLAERSITEDTIVLAADAAPNNARDAPDLDETATRAGWQDVLRRNDRLAEQCVRVVCDSGDDDFWAFGYVITIRRATAAGAEFLTRLTPAAERTAVYAAIDQNRTAIPMVDPATDIPVAVPEDISGKITALAPQRLPAVSPLAELILDDPIWVRCQDGTLYPAPRVSGSGLTWGHSGGAGTGTLAALADRLLTDITAQGTRPNDLAPQGLYDLLEQPWPAATVLTRAQLEAARDA